MSVLAAKANGNWTAAGTWGLVDSTSYSNSELNNQGLTTSLVSSSAFTPGAITIDGIGIKIAVVSSPTGTITVDLANAGVSVAGTSVTVNRSDLPAGALLAGADGGWFFFKFAAPVTLLGATAYTLRVQSSITDNLVTLFRDGTVSNWSRYLRTTTNQAPVAGDDTIITEEWTAAATGTPRTVTQNNNDATAYGSNTTSAVTPALAICKGGSLVWSVAASTNLRLKGHAIVYNGGTYIQGGVGTEIPRTFTSWLEFQCTADGDFGFLARNGSAVNVNGLSRTINKNVVNTLLTADVTNANLIASSASLTATASTLAAKVLAAPSGPILYGSVTDTVANAAHGLIVATAPSITNTTQIVSAILFAGTGTNKRFVRIQYGSSAALATGNGMFADVDLQAGTIGTCTGYGTGTGTSSAITALGGGYFLASIVGKGASGAQASLLCLFSGNANPVVAYAGDATLNFYWGGASVYTGSSIPNTTALTVADDTGWLSGDVIALASTSQTPQDCEPQALNGNAGASSITLANNLLYAHSGTSPTQAEVILLTRNCGIRGVAFSAVPVFVVSATAVGTANWAEFYNIGTNQAGAVGLSVNVTTGSFTSNYCSIHDTKNAGLFVSGAAVNNIAVTYLMMFNINTGGGALNAIVMPATTGTVLSLDHCIVMPVNVVTAGINIADLGTSVTNCTVCGVVTNSGFVIGESVTLQTGTFSGLTAHSNTVRGFSLTLISAGVLSNITAWRNSSEGILLNGTITSLTINTLTTFGNSSQNIDFNGAEGYVEINDATVNGDTTFPTTAGLLVASNVSVGELRLNRYNSGTVSGIKTAPTRDIQLNAFCFLRAFLNNSTLASATQVLNQSNLMQGSFIAAERLGGVAATHKTWKPNGTISYDSTIFGALTPSERLTPLSASAKLESGGKIIPLANGTTPTVTAKVRKSVIGDGAAYNGNQPRLVVKANPSLGLNVDTVLATASAAAGSFETLTATLPAPTDDGAFQVVVDCDGTTGWVNDDDIVATMPVLDGQQYWFEGLPGRQATLPRAAAGLHAIDQGIAA